MIFLYIITFLYLYWSFQVHRFFKTVLCIIVWCSICSLQIPFISASAYFTGFSGTALSVGQNSKGNLLDGSAATYFAGQVDWTNLFTIRTALTFKTAKTNILNTDIYTGISSLFRLDELSFTAKLHANDLSHYLSIFLGDFEPPGSSLFMQRQFGVAPFESALLRTTITNDNGSLYSFPGMGISYTLKFQQPMAARLAVYAKRYENAFDVNTDLRYAGVWQRWNIDALIGISFPIEKIDSGGKEVFVLIRTADLHAAVSMLVGNKYSHSLFMQLGIAKLRFVPTYDGEPIFSIDNINFVFEPRFTIKKMRINATIFNLDTAETEELFFVRNPLGIACSIYSDLIRAGTLPITAGGHIICTAKNMQLSSVADVEWHDVCLNITPFISLPLFSGIFTSAVTFDVLHFTDFTKTFGIMASYKVNL